MPSEKIYLLTDDQALFARLERMLPTPQRLTNLSGLDRLPEHAIALVDLDTLGLPAPDSRLWQPPCSRLRLGFLSSHPRDEEGIALLEAGACGYAHTYAAEATLRQMIEVIASGELWVGRSLMSRLLGKLKQVARPAPESWEAALTEREREVARMTAAGKTNIQIAEALGITERTVKAHLTAIFEKLDVADRLQLALKVHGIR